MLEVQYVVDGDGRCPCRVGDPSTVVSPSGGRNIRSHLMTGRFTSSSLLRRRQKKEQKNGEIRKSQISFT